MPKNIQILDSAYLQWVEQVSIRYRTSQIKAAVKVNQEQLRFYWELGRDIATRDAENRYGKGFYAAISRDLQKALPNVAGFSERNIRYAKRFYDLYSPLLSNLQQLPANSLDFVSQVEGQLEQGTKLPHLVAKSEESILPQVVANLQDTNDSCAEWMLEKLFSIPWGHQRFIMDKCSTIPEKALFFVQKTIENGWSRNMLLNFLSTDLYERQGKALSNFAVALPDATSDLAQEITKDPYNFAFTGITGKYNEYKLKDALLRNITDFLVELGTGFAYVGREYRLEIGQTENFIDLLFYNLQLSCYVVVEVKTGAFNSRDIGQLGTYVVACNHLLRKEGRDNPTIGLLICKEKDRVQAQYALESSTQPIGISEYELEKFYPEKVEGTMPSIEEIERTLEG